MNTHTHSRMRLSTRAVFYFHVSSPRGCQRQTRESRRTQPRSAEGCRAPLGTARHSRQQDARRDLRAEEERRRIACKGRRKRRIPAQCPHRVGSWWARPSLGPMDTRNLGGGSLPWRGCENRVRHLTHQCDTPKSQRRPDSLPRALSESGCVACGVRRGRTMETRGSIGVRAASTGMRSTVTSW
jgi:hypothetical protein